MLEKADDPFVREVVKCEARDLAVLVGGCARRRVVDP
jgi:hypothetical protein